MSVSYALSSALWGVRSSILRSTTTIVAVAGAACCALFCAAIIGGFDEALRRMTFGDNARALHVQPNPMTNARTGPPTDRDLAALRGGLPAVAGYAAWTEGNAAVRLAGETIVVPVFGASGDYRRELATTLSAGRWLTSDEVGSSARLCLVGPGAADRIGPGAELGRMLSLGRITCEVVGILSYPDSRPARRFSDAVVMPMELARRHFGTEDDDRNDLARFTLFFADEAAAATARQAVDGKLRKLHGISQSRLSPYIYDDTAADARDQARQRLMMARLLGSVTGITLVLSLLSYSAVMLTACRLRAREFAIRMAMGAYRLDIMRQIIVENVLLTLAGSTAGTGAGFVMARFATFLWGWPTHFDWSLAAATTAVSIVAGIVIGCYAGMLAGATPPAAARS